MAAFGEDPSPEILQRIGLVVTRWGAIEFLLARWLAQLVSATPARMAIVAADANSVSILRWIATLIELDFKGAQPDPIAQLLTDLDAARIERNSIAHATWTPGEGAAEAFAQTIKWSRAAVLEKRFVTVSELDDFARELLEIEARLIVVGMKWGFVSA